MSPRPRTSTREATHQTRPPAWSTGDVSDTGSARSNASDPAEASEPRPGAVEVPREPLCTTIPEEDEVPDRDED